MDSDEEEDSSNGADLSTLFTAPMKALPAAMKQQPAASTSSTKKRKIEVLEDGDLAENKKIKVIQDG